MIQSRRLLIVDDDPFFAETLAQTLEPFLPKVATATVYDLPSLEAFICEYSVDAVILDLSLDPKLGVDSGFQALQVLAKRIPETRVIVLTSHQSELFGVRAVQLGASSYIEKPGQPAQLAALVLDAMRQKKLLQAAKRGRITKLEMIADSIIGDSQLINNLRQQILFASSSGEVVHLFGEIGSGKSQVVRIINQLQSQSKRVLVFNCEELRLIWRKLIDFLSEQTEREFLFKLDDYSTLVFKDINKLGAETQREIANSLREVFLAQRENPLFPRLIFSYEILAEQMKSSSSLSEIAQVSGLIIFLPALRNLRDDLPQICIAILDSLNEESNMRIEKLSRNALQKLGEHSWLGNFKELRDVLAQAALRAQKRFSLVIETEDLVL